MSWQSEPLTLSWPISLSLLKTLHHDDIVIAGGGMVGSALACALGGTAMRCALLDREPAQTRWPTDSFDLRVSALTRASEYILDLRHPIHAFRETGRDRGR